MVNLSWRVMQEIRHGCEMSTRGNNLDTSKPTELVPYCSLDISKITSKEAALSRPFDICELNSPEKLNIHLRAYVDFYGGYSNHGRSVLFGLNNTGRFLIKLNPIQSLVDIDPFLHQKCSNFINTPGFNFKDSIFLAIAGPGWAQDKFIPKDGRYSIIWTMIETMCCHPEMKEWFKTINEIWAPTDCDVSRFRALEIPDNKIFKMHLGYDPIQYNETVQAMDIPQIRGKYVFGVLGSWNKRKGIKQIIRAFCRAFTPRDNVSLMLVCKYGTRPYDGIKDGETVRKTDTEKWDLNYEFKRYISDLRDIPHISVIDVPLHDNILPHVIANFDCGVGFSMGESTWLPGLEMMAMGLPVIQLQSQCSGFMEYMNEGNSYLCKKVDYVKADEELYLGTSDYYKDQDFAQGDELELAEIMQKVYRERNSDNQNHKCHRAIETVKHWTWYESIINISKRLEEIKRVQR